MQYQKKQELSFEGNNAFAKFLGYKFNWSSKAWEQEKAPKEPEIYDVEDGFAVVLDKDFLICVVDFKHKHIAKEAGFSWNAESKTWRKKAPSGKNFEKVDFSKIEQTPVSQQELEKVGVVTHLYDFQRAAVAKTIAQKSMLNACEMGNGKSIISIASFLMMRKEAEKLLIVCPVSLKINWKNEFLKHTKCFKDKDFYFWGKKSKQKGDAKSPVQIINYDILDKFKDELVEQKFAHIICDESHYLKNSAAKRTEALFYIKNESKIKSLQLLTGTPIGGKAAELWTSVALCDIDAFSFYGEDTFKEEFSNKVTKFFGRKMVTTYQGVKNAPELRAGLYPKMLRFEAKEVALPNFMKMAHLVEVPKAQIKKIEALIKELDLNESQLEALIESQSENSKVAFATLKSLLALIKVPQTVEFVKSLLEDDTQQVVVYSDHRASAQALAKAFGKKAGLLMGGCSGEERQKAVDDFQAGKIKVLVGTSAIATGLTLTAANILVINDSSYNVSTNKQLYKRIHRIGQEKRCIAYKVIVNNEIKNFPDLDRIISKILDKKEAVIDKINLG
jgi:SNF2 family DNA or RNA helicase